MFRLSEQFSIIRTRLKSSWLPAAGPTLPGVSQQLRVLSSLVAELGGEVHRRATESAFPTPRDRHTISVLSSAIPPAARALDHLTEACVQLGAEQESWAHPAHHDLTKLRSAAVAVSIDRVNQADTGLREAAGILRDEVYRAGLIAPRAMAARSRTPSPPTRTTGGFLPSAPTPGADREPRRNR
jgi:hypothetical protein